MQSRSYLFLAIVVALTALSGFLYTKQEFNLGLDVKGGVRLTYKMDLSKLPKGESPAAAQEQIASVLERRAAGLGVAEPLVQKKGTDELIVELPGATNIAKAEETLGTTAKIEWFHATNLVTPKALFREYQEMKADGDKPEVWFQRRNDTKIIKPGDPEYLKVIKGWTKILEGTELSDAQPVPHGDGYIPSMSFNREGARKMEAWSRANTYRGEMLAAVLDDTVLSVAPLREGAIISDNGVIEGTFSTEYVKSLCDMLRSGSLPVTINKTSSALVDATVGKFALDRIVLTGAIAFGLIALFLIVYYVFPGFIALIALVLYVLFTLTVLKWANATFSLAAIAGFVLSVGMAVDANILVFERMREELREGRTLQKAIDLGFRRALPAIIDSNACTILTSLVLANLGTGPVKGFAITLIIGVLISLFTAITVTRSLLQFFVGSGIGANPKWYGLNHEWFGKRLTSEASDKPLKILEKTKLYFIISALTIIPGIIFYSMGGLKKNVEFTGGFEGIYLIKEQTAEQIKGNLTTANIKHAEIQFQSAGNERMVIITVPPEDAKTLGTTSSQIRDGLAKAAGFTIEEQRGFSEVSSTIRDETIRNAILGVVFSAGLIIAWLAIRFGFALGGFIVGLRFAMSVILALLHDVFVVLGLAAVAGALWGWQISALFISAMLTVIGFSTHDTIVIFDRIRENLRKPMPGEGIEHLINRSITQSFSRSLNTSGTVILTLFLLIFYGSATPELKLFNAAMLIGILSGTYSSIFNAAPILYLWDRAVARKQGEEHSLIGMARSAVSKVRLTRDSVTPTTVHPVATSSTSTGYGQTKRRRASDAQKGIQSIDEE